MHRVLAILFAIPLFFACTSDEQVATNQPDLASGLQGDYIGILEIRYSAFPDRNTSESTTTTVFYEAESTVRVDNQGGDTFVGTLSGSSTTPTFDEVLETTGVYDAGSLVVAGFFNFSGNDIGIDYDATMPYTEGGTFTVSFQGTRLP